MAKTPTNVLMTSNRQFDILQDKSRSAVSGLEKRFYPIQNEASIFCTTIASLATFLRVSFSDTTTKSSSYISTKGKTGADNYTKDITTSAISCANKPEYKLEIQSNNVIMPMTPIVFSATEITASETIRESLQHKLDTLFGTGKVTLPNTIRYGVGYALELGEGEGVETGFQSLSYFTRMDMQNVQNSVIYAPPKFVPMEHVANSLKGSDINFDKMMSFNVTLTEIRVTNGFYVKEGMPIDSARLTLTFRVECNLNFPMLYALWLTHATSARDFVPKLFVEQIYRFFRAALVPGNKVEKGFERTMHLGIVKEINDGRQQEYGIEPKPRANRDGFSVTSKGHVVYIPDVNNTKKYTDILRASYDPETRTIKPNSKIPELRDMPIYTDWINDAFGYTNTEGNPNSVNLHGAVELSDITIGADLRSLLISNFTDPDENILAKNFMKFGEEVCSLNHLYDPSFIQSGAITAIAASFQGLCIYLAKYKEESLANLFLGLAKDDEEDRSLINEWRRLCREISNHIMNTGTIAYSNRINFKYYFQLIGVYSHETSAFFEKINAGVESNAPVKQEDANTSFAIPNLPGIPTVLPHQSRFFTASDRSPVFMSVGAAVGAGKTLMIAGDIIKQFEAKKAKRGLVVVPGVLVKEYCNELNAYSQGHINAVPITASTVKRMIANLHFTKKKFLSYIKNAPINTIFVASYNFMKARTDYFDGYRAGAIQFGEEIVPFYPMAQLLRSVGFDIISMDESHFIKNETADQTKAVKFLTPTVPMRRVASGTIDMDNPSDTVSQVGVFDPSILKTKENFINRYSTGDGTGKFSGWKKGAVREYFSRIAPYYSRYEATKVDWSQLLPKINVNLISGVMTRNQQIFYESLLSAALEEMEKDRSLTTLLENGDESDAAQAKIENAIKQTLQNVEGFIYAPDNNPSFEAYIREKRGSFNRKTDNVSCVVPLIDECIDKHIHGYTEEVDGKEVHYPPNKNKIIVTFINRAASRHALKYSKYKNLAAHYAVENPLVSNPSTGELEDGPKDAGISNLERFRDPNNKKVMILFADINSIRAGMNLQIGSRIIRVQTPWSPGEATQEEGRIVRPDVQNKFGRENVFVDWLMVERSHVTAKIARLISKTVMIHEKNTADNSSWHDWERVHPLPPSSEIPPVKMNLDELHKLVTSIKAGITQGFEPNTSPDFIALRKYFEAYANISNWEDGEFKKNIENLRLITAKRLGVDPKSISNLDLRTMSMLPNDGSKRLSGSKSIYVPIEAGTIPVDKRGLNLVPLARIKEKERGENSNDEDDLGIIDEEDDTDNDENKELEDNVEINEGDIVQTEYGMGEIVQIRKGRNGAPGTSVKVLIPGMDNITDGKPISFNKRLVFLPHPPVIDPDVPSTVDTFNQWQANLNKLKKDYTKAKNKGIGITYLNGMDLDDQLARPEIKIEPKTPAPTKPKNTNVNDKEHPGSTGDVPDGVDTDSILKKLYEQAINSKPNTDKLPNKAPPKRSRTDLDVDVDIVNGMVAIQFYTDDNNYPALKRFDKSLYDVPEFMDIHIKTYKGAVTFLNMVDENFTLPESVVREGKVVSPGSRDKILAIAKKMRMRGSSTDPLSLGTKGSQVPFATAMSNFFKIEHKSPRNNSGERPGIKMYPVIWDDNLYICMPIHTQPRQYRKLKQLYTQNKSKMKVGTNIGPLSTVGDCSLKLIHTPAQAVEYLDKLSLKFNIPNMQELVRKLKSSSVRRLLMSGGVDNN